MAQHIATIAAILDTTNRGRKTTVGPANYGDATLALRARQSAARHADIVARTVAGKAERKAARAAKRATSYSDTELVALALSMTTTD